MAPVVALLRAPHRPLFADGAHALGHVDLLSRTGPVRGPMRTPSSPARSRQGAGQHAQHRRHIASSRRHCQRVPVVLAPRTRVRCSRALPASCSGHVDAPRRLSLTAQMDMLERGTLWTRRPIVHCCSREVHAPSTEEVITETACACPADGAARDGEEIACARYTHSTVQRSRGIRDVQRLLLRASSLLPLPAVLLCQEVPSSVEGSRPAPSGRAKATRACIAKACDRVTAPRQVMWSSAAWREAASMCVGKLSMRTVSQQAH